jgi:hypothetical protein
MKLRLDEWNIILPVVQGALNHQSADRLDGVAPLTAFLGLPAKTPIFGFVHPRTKEVHSVDWLKNARKKHITDLSDAMDKLHRDVSVHIDKLRRQAREDATKQLVPSLQTSLWEISFRLDRSFNCRRSSR